MEASSAAIVSAIVTVTVFNILIVFLFIALSKIVSSYIYKKRLKQIDLVKYTVFSHGKGKPNIFQNKTNPNDLIFI